MTRRSALAALCLAVLSGACASYYVPLGDDGGSPIPGDASATGTPTTIVPSADGAVPAPPPADASTDAAPTSPCVGTMHFLCADFDTSKLEVFTRSRVDPFGTLAVSNAHAAGGQGSLLATLPRRGGAANDAFARAEKVATGWRKVKIDFDVRIETADFQGADTPIALGGVFMTSTEGYTGALLFTDGVSSAVSVEGRATRYFETDGQLGQKRWTHVSIGFDPTSARVDFVVDGKPGSGVGQIAPAGGSGQETEIAIGVAAFDGPTPNVAVHYDNVVVDLP